jgi:hypothetical protein
MVQAVKITSLNDIGTSIMYTTLVPVVNMTGTPTTEKANLQIVGNLILSEAGGSYFPPAAQATVAQVVAYAAQPNITSVGTLNSLDVLGNINAGNANLGNLAIANVFSGTLNGSAVSANIANTVAFNAQPNITSLGTLTSLNVTGLANLGAVTNITITGGNPNYVLQTDGFGHLSWAAQTGGGGNANTGNITFNNANISTNLLNTDIQIIGNGTGDVNVVANNKVWTFNADGNLTTPGNIIVDVVGDAIIESSSNVNVSAGGYIWTFGTDGNLTFPNDTITTGNEITPATGANFVVTTSSLESVSSDCYIGLANEFVADTEFNDDITVVQVGWTVTISSVVYTVSAIDPSPPAFQFRATVIGATFVSGTNYTFTNPVPIEASWSINQYGTLNAPGGSRIVADDSAFEVQNANAINFEAINTVNIYTDTANNSWQWQFSADGYMRIPNDGSFGALNSSVLAFSSQNNTPIYIEVVDTGNSAARQWVFDNAGNLTLPGNTFAVNYANGTQVNIGGGSANTGNVTFTGNVISTSGTNNLLINLDGQDFIANTSNGGAIGLYSGNSQIDINNDTPGIEITSLNVNLVALAEGDIYLDATAANGAVDINSDGNTTITANGNVWTFDSGGSLTLPSSTGPSSIAGHIQTANSYPTLLAYGSNGHGGPELDWLDSDDPANNFSNGNVLRHTMYLNDDEGLYIGFNENNVANVPSPNWRFTTDGNLVLPGTGTINNQANSSLDPITPTASTMVLTPDSNYLYQSLVLDPTSPGHIHLRSPATSGGNIDQPTANIFLGGELSSFEVGASYGGTPNVFIHSGGNTWTFGTDGNLTTPGVAGNITGANVISANTFVIIGNTELGQIEGPNTVGFYNADPTEFLLELGANPWSFNGNTGYTLFPILTTQRGDNPSGTISGYTLNGSDGNQEFIITTSDGNVTVNNSQRIVINPGMGAGNTAGEGGDIYLWAGRGGNGDAGNAISGGSGGDIKIRGGQGGGVNGLGGYIRMEAGDGATSGGPGFIEITGGAGGTGQNGGYVRILSGQGALNGGDANLTGGTGTAGTGGTVNIAGGGSGLGLADYGNVNIIAGASTWRFDNTGNLTLPGEGIIRSNNDTVTLESYDVANTTAYKLRLGDNGGVYLEQGANSAWLSLNPNAGNAEIYAGIATGGAAGHSLSIAAGAADQTDFYTTAGGNVNIVGGLGAGNDGGGGGPGGSVNIAAGNSADPAGHAGNININSGIDTWTFDYTGNLTTPGSIITAGSGGNIALTGGDIVGANVVSANTINVTGNISGNTNGYTIGYLNIPQVEASNTTIALSDAGKHYYSTSSGNFTLTIPNNSTTTFATGTAINIVVQSAGNILVNAASGVTLYMAGNSTAANRVVSNYGMATLMKVATDTWMIGGTGVA